LNGSEGRNSRKISDSARVFADGVGLCARSKSQYSSFQRCQRKKWRTTLHKHAYSFSVFHVMLFALSPSSINSSFVATANHQGKTELFAPTSICEQDICKQGWLPWNTFMRRNATFSVRKHFILWSQMLNMHFKFKILNFLPRALRSFNNSQAAMPRSAPKTLLEGWMFSGRRFKRFVPWVSYPCIEHHRATTLASIVLDFRKFECNTCVVAYCSEKASFAAFFQTYAESV